GFRGVGGGGRGVAALEEAGAGLGVLAVALGLPAGGGPHGPGVPQDEGDVLVAAGVGEPVPAVHALAGADQAVAEGGDGAEEGARVSGQVLGEDGLAVVVEGDDEDGPGVQIDAGVESGSGGRGKGTQGEGFLIAGRGDVPHPIIAEKAFMGIQALRPTSGARRLFVSHSPPSPAGRRALSTMKPWGKSTPWPCLSGVFS